MTSDRRNENLANDIVKRLKTGGNARDSTTKK